MDFMGNARQTQIKTLSKTEGVKFFLLILSS